MTTYNDYDEMLRRLDEAHNRFQTNLYLKFQKSLKLNELLTKDIITVEKLLADDIDEPD